MMSQKSNNMFYACFLEENKESLILNSWEECQDKIKGKKARYKKFKTKEEAQNWLENGALYSKKIISENNNLDKEAIYFDAGTGRGIGVEVRLTDFKGNSLLHKIMPKNKINQFGNYLLSQGRTNNFGELTGLFISLKYAKKYNTKIIYGDSNLVIEYWCHGHYNEKNLDEDTIDLILKVKNLYEEYTLSGGLLKKISGDINPSDLGFHK